MDDLISRQAAIERATKDHDFYKGATTPADMARGDELLNVMCWLGELPSAQPETADCIYCHEDSDGYVKPIEKNCHALIRFGMNGWEISLSAKGWNGSAKIMYCPMCGRRLNE